MSPSTPPNTLPNSCPGFSLTRIAAVLVLTAVTAAGSFLMVGPQIMIIVPVAIGAGIIFAIRRFFWALICFGYPFTFGLVSAWIGYKEMPGYERTGGFAVSIGLGLVGVSLVAMGLWKVLPGRTGRESSVNA